MTISMMAIVFLTITIVILVIEIWWLCNKYNRTCDEKNACIRQLLAESKEKDKEIKRMQKGEL
jgi:F0F1-type ATP synthase membrane subunit b/b'